MSAGVDDPYNIPIDLSNIKNKYQHPKTFEEKSTEEKLRSMQQMQKEMSTSEAKSIMKKPGESKSKNSVAFGQCVIYDYDKDKDDPGKRVDTKDISDMRDEKTKIRDML